MIVEEVFGVVVVLLALSLYRNVSHIEFILFLGEDRTISVF